MLSKFIIFAVGAAIGSAVTWKVIKDKYEQIAQEEIDSVKEVFSKRGEKLENEFQQVTDNMNVVSMYPETPLIKQKTYTDTDIELAHSEYKNYASRYASDNETKPEKEEEDEDMEKPYVIPPDEFGDYDYETVSLTYYADHVLTYESDELVEDIDDIIGSESLDHFGEYEDDSVFVRNDKLETDYEILLDTRNYYDIYPDRVRDK